MTVTKDVAIPKDSLVLVTGITGFIGSNVADQFLNHGYRVRGTTRDAGKAAWLSALFEEKYGKGRFELATVVDMAADGAYLDAVKGASAVAHVASDMSMDYNPNNVIPSVVAGALSALKAAIAEPSVKRFIYTSSSSAAKKASTSKEVTVVTQETWNDEAITAAWAEPPYEPSRASAVYSASKTAAEKETWALYREAQKSRPDLIMNTVLPNVNFGPSLNPEVQGHPSTSYYPVLAWKGDRASIEPLLPQYFVNVQDTARLHVAAAILPEVKNERIFAYAGRFNWDTVLDILRKHNPEREFLSNFHGGQDSNVIQPAARAEELLRQIGRAGWTSLEDSIVANTADLHD
ncbi:hypothetical protein JDV02_005679 [Purpureocillium takamizusanense]|uniref:NAD-dependent epimerase/dehydratase domain-containing protein n=1 Tax=Purpureocillium takamizusanense TaxID=2060973 RepID=A0A9Q8QHT2_9HYPO|nr:uncharacterized protein JDV02_005679 [Purpureocillium takamizusanense]UNI19497.1 hypothetical protein JDV02_005679 [Purpureocillium takamizusanense]